MWVSALFGMASSFVEATLAQIFKEKDGDEFVGGLPYYGRKLLGNRKWVGTVLAGAVYRLRHAEHSDSDLPCVYGLPELPSEQ